MIVTQETKFVQHYLKQITITASEYPKIYNHKRTTAKVNNS